MTEPIQIENENSIPGIILVEGEPHLLDADERKCPVSRIKDIDVARHSIVWELTELAKKQNEELIAFRKRVFADLYAFVDLSAEQYDVKLGGKKGNITLTTYDRKYKIQIAISDVLKFDEQLQAAKKLIDECITTWTVGVNVNVGILVQDAFQVNKDGKISTARVLGLRRLNIVDAKWILAMEAISNSLSIATSREYVRFFVRVGASDKYQAISLDIANC